MKDLFSADLSFRSTISGFFGEGWGGEVAREMRNIQTRVLNLGTVDIWGWGIDVSLMWGSVL